MFADSHKARQRWVCLRHELSLRKIVNCFCRDRFLNLSVIERGMTLRGAIFNEVKLRCLPLGRHRAPPEGGSTTCLYIAIPAE